MNDRIGGFRSLGQRWLMALLAVNVIATAGVSLSIGANVIMVVLASLVCGAVGAFALLGVNKSPTHRAIFAISAQAQVAVFVAAFAGHAWQIDAHMHFFATLGVLILLVDYRAVLAGSAAVAVHHLVLNFALPALVFPGGTDLGRTIMHAVILILATGALCYASAALQAIMAEAEQQRIAREGMVDKLSSSLGQAVRLAVEGDFSGRINAQFDDPRLQEIANGTNGLIASVGDSISETCGAMDRVVQGDLTAQVKGEHHGSFAQLQSDVNATIDRLRDVVGKIDNLSHGIAAVSCEISEGSAILSGQAKDQVGTVQETAATMQILTGSVKSNVESAGSMASHASQTLQEGRAGQDIVTSATDAMQKMANSADKINEIVSMMDEISFQTNLLALNASVEAARAGDAGQGFAVVASEVRALALRSADSSTAIRDLVSQSVTDVSSGVKLVDQLGATLTAMVQSVGDVAEKAEEIATSGAEQAQSIQGMAANVEGIEHVTRQTSATAEAYAQKAQKLQDFAHQLETTMKVFLTKVDAETPAKAA